MLALPFIIYCYRSVFQLILIKFLGVTINHDITMSEPVLPSPKKVLFEREKIHLGWEEKTVSIGLGMVNMQNSCFLNCTLQVSLSQYIKNYKT